MMSSESNGTRRERLRVCRKGAQEKENLRALLEMKLPGRNSTGACLIGVKYLSRGRFEAVSGLFFR
ncbi:MAG: hypothetical protein BHW61_01255 [Sutterella sp. 63_29]|nr:MAG: hypothetical protein BHW61_01255 [Sutterella sp. 63_29]